MGTEAKNRGAIEALDRSNVNDSLLNGGGGGLGAVGHFKLPMMLFT